MNAVILSVIAALGAGAVLRPLLAAGRAGARPSPVPAELDDAALDREVARYREAIRGDTLCGRCRFANPPGSRYCADCGKRLPGA